MFAACLISAHSWILQANILIDEHKQVRLGDFGLADLVDLYDGESTAGRGSVRWMAPELHGPERFGLTFRRTPVSDVYAFACTCIEVIPVVPIAWNNPG